MSYDPVYGGDGSPYPIGPQLIGNPGSVDFGEVTQAAFIEIDVELSNIGDEDCSIFGVTSTDSNFTITSQPSTISAGSSAFVTIRFTAGAPGADSATITIDSDAINNPVYVACSAVSVAAGTIAISVEPPNWIFDNTKVAATSDIKVFTITNTGTVNVTINNVVIDAPFAAAAPIPVYPQLIAAGGTLDFGVALTPVAAGYITDTSGIHITSTAPTSPDLIALAGLAVLITPVYTVNLGVGVTAVGFMDPATSDPVAKQFDWEDWDCEEDCFATRSHDFGKPGESKTYYQFFVLHEDKGAATISVAVGVHGTTKTESGIALGDNASDDILMADAEDLKVYSVNGVLKVTLTREADDGPVSIVEMIHVFDTMTRLGTTVVPVAITPVYTVTLGDPTLTICGFEDGTVKAFDWEDLDCEETSTATRDRNLLMPGFQSSLMRAQVNYEDKGVASVAISAANRYGQTSSQTNSMGTVGADDSIQQKLFDLDVEDEVLHVILTRTSGPLSLTGLIFRHVDRGEVKK